MSVTAVPLRPIKKGSVGRIWLGVAVVVVLLAVRPAGWKKVGAALLAIVVGIAASWPMLSNAASGRVTDQSGDGGPKPRLEIWGSAMRAIGKSHATTPAIFLPSRFICCSAGMVTVSMESLSVGVMRGLDPRIHVFRAPRRGWPGQAQP